jgi:hypothetical protein
VPWGGSLRWQRPRRPARPGLWNLLDALPRTHWPTFLRGDCAYGHEALLCAAETRDLPYLCKLRHTAKVKTLVGQMQRRGAAWEEAGDGWEVLEATLRLSGWSCERRVVLVSETPALAPSAPRPSGGATGGNPR